MGKYFPAATVSGYEPLIAEIHLPDPEDRHVLAAAAHGQADIIVTLNLRDFPPTQLARYALTARHPDTFIIGLFDAQPQETLLAFREHRQTLANPPKSPQEYIAALTDMNLVQTALILQNCESVI